MSLYQHVSQFPSASVELKALETYHGNDFWSTGAACTSCARATDAHAQAIDSQPCALHYSQPTWLLLRATPPEKCKQTPRCFGQVPGSKRKTKKGKSCVSSHACFHL